jgi:hypothetical protein
MRAIIVKYLYKIYINHFYNYRRFYDDHVCIYFHKDRLNMEKS